MPVKASKLSGKNRDLAKGPKVWYALNIRPVMYTGAMRIACVFAPHVPLQALVRRRPELRKQPVAVVTGGPSSTVVACSRAAHGAGVRVGMTALAARQRSADLLVLPRDAAAESQLEAALVEGLYGISTRVEAESLRRGRKLAAVRERELGVESPSWQGRGTLFAQVPTGMRGATFGVRVLELAAALDVSVRVGIADDRFTAWVAARHLGQPEESPVVAVPRGGSAAFLAPQPLAMLDISPEVRQMLGALGVNTLGEFARLPAPSVARRWDFDLQALARGEGGAELEVIAPATLPLREEVELSAEFGLGAAVTALAERVALRLAGRGGVAAAMEVISSSERGDESSTLWLVPPLHHAEALADRIGRALAAGPLRRIAVSVTVSDAAEASPAVASAPAVEDAVYDGPAEDLAPIGMSGALLRWAGSDDGEALKPHRRTRRGKQRRRVVSAQVKLFGGD
jgi:protein ImuB